LSDDDLNNIVSSLEEMSGVEEDQDRPNFAGRHTEEKI